MEKKEPVLTAEKEEVASSEVQEIKVTEKSDTGVVASSSNKKSFWKSLSKKTWAIIAVVLIAIALVVAFVVYSGKGDKANVAKVGGEKSLFEKVFGDKTEDDAKAKVIAPSFDIVRMEKGEVVIAGQAGAEAVVHVLDNGYELGTEKADANGQWVFIPKKALPVGNRKLSLYVVDENGNKVYSKQSAVLHVSKKPAEEMVVLVGKTKKGPKSKVLKSKTSNVVSAVRVAKIDYDDEGAFVVEGLAKRGADVIVYMNNKAIGNAKADSVGVWSLDVKYAMKAEENTLRADMVNANGKVIARVEYKFTPVMLEKENAMSVVKKGDCLWNIALREYGRGSAYVIIFEANKSQIKNPDMIYVGQVFNIVKKDGEVFNKLEEEGKHDAAAKSRVAAKVVPVRVAPAPKSERKVFKQRTENVSRGPRRPAVSNKVVVKTKVVKKNKTNKGSVREAGSQPVKLIRD